MPDTDSSIRNAPLGPCPDESLWERFATGALPPKTVDELASHLTLCHRCQAVVSTVHSRPDSLQVGLIRGRSADSSVDERHCQEVLARIVDPGELDEIGRSKPPSGSDAYTLPEQIGPYEVGEKLGEGGMGVVYRAVDSRLKRVVRVEDDPARLGAGRSGDRSVSERG